MQAIFRDAYTWRRPQSQSRGTAVPPYTYMESNKQMALPKDYDVFFERKNYTVCPYC